MEIENPGIKGRNGIGQQSNTTQQTKNHGKIPQIQTREQVRVHINNIKQEKQLKELRDCK